MRRSFGFFPLCFTVILFFLIMPCVLAQKGDVQSTPPLLDSGQLAKMLLQSLWELARTFWYVGVLFVAVAVTKILVARAQYKKLAASGILQIDEMDGRTFERYLETLFGKLGYTVELTSYAGDWGADLVLRKENVKTVVQAKRYKKAVGVKAIQEVVASKNKYGCANAMVVTNSSYTNQAQELARVNNVTLWDRHRLTQALLSVNKETSIPSSSTTTVSRTDSQNASPADTVAAGSCCICNKPVSAKVLVFCRNNPGRFGGRTYCFGHQRQAS